MSILSSISDWFEAARYCQHGPTLAKQPPEYYRPAHRVGLDDSLSVIFGDRETTRQSSQPTIPFTGRNGPRSGY